MKKRKEKHYPQVLLLGNGINQLNGGASWNEFLLDIAVKREIVDGTFPIDKLDCPEPLKAILVTDDHVDMALKKYWNEYQPKMEVDYSFCQKLLSLGFDDILSTNYTYELEQAAIYPQKITKGKLIRMMRHTEGTEKAEGKYLLHTYNEVVTDARTNRVWHIHGEARKPDSTILGHYYYGNLFYKIKNELENRRYDTKKERKSWIDSFILGDVYILGFGFGLSEFDLWWLINRKAREKVDTGKIYFYEPAPSGFSEKHELLRLLRRKSDGEPLVQLLDCGFQKIMVKDSAGKEKEVLNGEYADFYSAAIDHIKMRMYNKEK